MSSVRSLCFPSERSPERLDSFIAESLEELSRSQLKRLIDEGRVTLDGYPAKPSHKLKGGETILVSLPDPQPTAAVAEAIPLEVFYEDADLIVVNKPAGMVVHPAAGHQHGTLVNALLHHCRDLAGIGGELRPGIVHRLDKDTSGLLVACKNDSSHQHLAAQFKRHSIQRRYQGLIHGRPDQPSGVIDQPIGRHPLQRKKMSGRAKRTKTAVTRWQLDRNYPAERLSLLDLRLETGRTHQIRVHFAERGLPLVGDPLYGSPSKDNALADEQLRQLVKALPGQALHAARLGFIHPTNGKYLDFSCPMPDTLGRIINHLEQSRQAD